MGKIIQSLQAARRIGQPLSEATVGQRVVLHSTQLETADRELLSAMGVVDDCVLEVCRQGEPCIVSVGTTRVGLSRTLACNIWVHERRESCVNTAIRNTAV